MGIIISPTTQETPQDEKQTDKQPKTLLSKISAKFKRKDKKKRNPNTLDNELLSTFSKFETTYPDILHQYIVQYHLARTFEFPKKKRHRLSTVNIPTVQTNDNDNIIMKPKKLPKIENPQTLNRSLELEFIDSKKKVSIVQEGGENLAEYQIIKEEFIYDFIEFEKNEYKYELATGLKLNFFDIIEEFMKTIDNTQ